MEMTLKKEVFNVFIKAINARDIITMKGYMADNHVFEIANLKSTNKIDAEDRWSAFFTLFPDYSIEISSSGEIDHKIVAFCIISGSLNGTGKFEDSFSFNAALRADIENGKIAAWQIFADDRIMSNLMQSSQHVHKNILAVQGMGGVFFKAKDPKVLATWYDRHLGTNFGSGLSTYFKWRNRENPNMIGSTSFGIFSEKSEYYSPSEKPFMFNFRVNNLDSLIEIMRRDSIQIVGEIERFEYGNFGWVMDPEGNKIELWEPIDQVLEDYENQQGK